MKVFRKGKPSKLIFISVQPTLNNIFYTVFTRRGNVLFWISAGSSGFKGPRRSTPLAAEQTAKILVDRLVTHGFRRVELKVFAVNRKRVKAALRGFSHGRRLSIKSIFFCPPVLHGSGLRPKKLRRV